MGANNNRVGMWDRALRHVVLFLQNVPGGGSQSCTSRPAGERLRQLVPAYRAFCAGQFVHPPGTGGVRRYQREIHHARLQNTTDEGE